MKSIIFSYLIISLATKSISPKLSANPSLIADSPDQKRPEKVSLFTINLLPRPFLRHL